MLLPRGFGAIPLAIGLFASSPAVAQYFGDGKRESDSATPLAYKEDGKRSTREVIVLSSLFGGAALLAGTGTYFLFDSRSKSDLVSASVATGRAWTTDKQATYEEAETSATVATVTLGIAGALGVVGIAAFIITAPESGGYKNWQGAYVAPAADGAMAGASWIF